MKHPLPLLIGLLLPCMGSAGQIGLPDPNRLLLATSPSMPVGMRETANAARIIAVSMSVKPFDSSPQSQRMSARASLCIVSWSTKSPEYKFPGNFRMMWGVYDSMASAKIGALSRTWGQRARPPKSSIPKGTFSGKKIGDQTWHFSGGSPATIIVRDGQIVAQVIFQPASKLNGNSVAFSPIRKADLARMEAIAVELVKKTRKFLKG